MQYSFTHMGRPVPKGRPRFTKYGGVYTPRETAQAEAEIAYAYLRESGPLYAGPIGLSIDLFPDRTEVQLWPEDWDSSLRGDIDNYTKLVLDALEKNAFHNDRQIVHLMTRKY